MSKILEFPKGFLWGTATSAYQIEGGIKNNDWVKFYDAGKACDHYNRYEEDFDWAKKLNQNIHRFSIEWSRIEPHPGIFDKKEIRHYWEVLFALKNRGIKTMVTLHHFTNPLWLDKIGGWTNKKSVFYFSRFAERVFNEYQNLVDYWLTINEPFIYGSQSFLSGNFPPGRRNPILFLKVIKNQILSHKKIYEIFHKSEVCSVQVGIAKNNCYFEPKNPNSPFDKLSISLTRYFWNEYFLDKIKNHLDFIGLNYYFHRKIKFPFLTRNDNKIVSDLGWEIFPEGIYHILKDLGKYKLPIFITENGLADAQDRLRSDFIKEHLIWIYKAMKESINVQGYLHWSLIDNFEWHQGFGPRFGLVEIDYKTMKRKPRPSAFYFSKICRENQLVN